MYLIKIYSCFKNIVLLLLSAWVFIYWNSALAGSYNEFFDALNKDEHAVILSLLQRGFDPNTPTADGQTPLIQSIKAGANKTTRILATFKGVDLERTNLQDETPLMMASINANVEVAKLLLELNAEVNKPGWGPLHYAATKGSLEIMKLLLERSAYVDSESPNKTTPLMMAARYGTFDAVKLLIEEGADPTLENNLKLSATDFAGMANNPKLVSYLKTQAAIWIMSHD